MEVDNVKLQKLIGVHMKHPTIIVGVDFDDTVFPLDERYRGLCKDVRDLLVRLKPFITICLYTVADEQSIKYKVELMKLWGIEPRYVNESPIKLGNGAKPYFNVLLDDKAGLVETILLLEEFYLNTKN